MPSKKQYDLVQNDDYDTRIPLHPEEAFHHGITFQAKFIGMLDVPKPSSRVEIVAAMRRIRYEFKAKGIKKKKVTIEVSVDGVKVTLRKKKKKKHWLDDGKSLLLSHPIYRIFYVSHDSQDHKIFSYIARDGASNVFKCAVFKSNKKSQAMRVVRTIGQAFEVCHKLSINSPPENEHLDPDDQETLTQDLLSDRLSDITSDKHKRDLVSEGASDRMSLPPDDSSLKDCDLNHKPFRTSPQLEVIPAPHNMNTKKLSLAQVETYAAPHCDALMSTTASSSIDSCNLPPVGSPLSAHHELQLMREQLEQQQQQTREAMAQLQLVREQLAAEQSARLEAQARTHQLLVHNRELLDHIAALVAHLQGGDKPGQQSTPPHMTMPQHQHSPGTENLTSDVSDRLHMDNNFTMQCLGWNPSNLIENRCVTGVPPSPLRSSYNPAGNIFNYTIPPPVDSTSYETQLLQRLQALSGYTSPLYPYHLPQTMPYLPTSMYGQSLLNNNYPLQMPPQGKLNPNQPSAFRNSYSGSTVTDSMISSSRSSEPRQLPSTPQYQVNPMFQFSVPLQPNFENESSNLRNDINLKGQYQSSQYNKEPQKNQNIATGIQDAQTIKLQYQKIQSNPNQSLQAQPQTQQKHPNQNQSVTNLRILHSQQKEINQNNQSSNEREGTQFIKPLPTMGTLTTTDSEGRVRVIAPVPTDSAEDTGAMLANLKLGNTLRPLNGPGITRSTSERVPNRSELMSQVQRTVWARHTTK